jgi:hypothetical protein
MYQKPDFTASADWNRLNLRSVTDQNSLDEFLTTAQMAGTDFAAGNLADCLPRCHFNFRTFKY